MLDADTAKGFALLLLTAVGFFLKNLHGKIERAVTREEFNQALASMRLEHQDDRRELRENQLKLFEKLDFQQQLLTQVATKVSIMAESRRHDV